MAMIKFTEEQKKALVYEFTKRSERIKQFKPDTLRESLTLEGCSDCYKWLAEELALKDGLSEWE